MHTPPGLWLALLICLVVCASAAIASQGRTVQDPGFYCASSYTSPLCKPGAAGSPPLKCERCKYTLTDLIPLVTPLQQTTPDYCFQPSGGNGRPDYNQGSAAPGCSNAASLIYNGGAECRVTICSAVKSCLSHPLGFNNCLCGWNQAAEQISEMWPCFKKADVRDRRVECPNRYTQGTKNIGQRNPNPKVSAGARPPPPAGHLGVSISDNDTGDGSAGDSNTEFDTVSSTSPNGNPQVYYDDDWPPDTSQQFSPVLRDGDQSFYLDVWERVVLVDTNTLNIIYYEPYYLREAPSFDQLYDVPTDENVKIVKRCWLYPFSVRLWCYWWYIMPDEFADFDYAKDNSNSHVGANITDVGGHTSIPTTYSSIAYTKAGPIPTTTPTQVTTAADAKKTGSPGSAGGSTKGASSAAASQSVYRSWFGIFQILAVSFYYI
ncbi:hypothetical protein IF1G_10880 [Cordyceps javanica]|uniref:Uncharacterized protein n=1 Tax=Cordyceps javanica TaxID=43265 RepID=A0A545ULR2_9HYPO|nr:hypothetical protein IF1G_10880 [Cordyceps javanica]TQW01979.1 hypothetical protein IF2G_10550 [Cordyceps javanica]